MLVKERNLVISVGGFDVKLSIKKAGQNPAHVDDNVKVNGYISLPCDVNNHLISSFCFGDRLIFAGETLHSLWGKSKDSFRYRVLHLSGDNYSLLFDDMEILIFAEIDNLREKLAVRKLALETANLD